MIVILFISYLLHCNAYELLDAEPHCVLDDDRAVPVGDTVKRPEVCLHDDNPTTWSGNCLECRAMEKDDGQKVAVFESTPCEGRCPKGEVCEMVSRDGKDVAVCTQLQVCELSDGKKVHVGDTVSRMITECPLEKDRKWIGLCDVCRSRDNVAEIQREDCEGECREGQFCVVPSDRKEGLCYTPEFEPEPEPREALARSEYGVVSDNYGYESYDSSFMNVLVLNVLVSAVTTLCVIAVCLTGYYVMERGKAQGRVEWQKVAN